MQGSNRRMTPKGQMSGNGSGPAVAHLPPHMKAMFEPGPPLDHRPKIVKRKMPALSGMAMFIEQVLERCLCRAVAFGFTLFVFLQFEATEPPQRVVQETPNQRKTRKRKAKMEVSATELEENKAKWDPHTNDDTNLTGDAYKTLFVARVSHDTSEKKLKREFEEFGPIKKVNMVNDKDGKPRGYAFVEFERESDMRTAYKHGDGRKVDGRRVLVDVERGRTVRNWCPRKLGRCLACMHASLPSPPSDLR